MNMSRNYLNDLIRTSTFDTRFPIKCHYIYYYYYIVKQLRVLLLLGIPLTCDHLRNGKEKKKKGHILTLSMDI